MIAQGLWITLLFFVLLWFVTLIYYNAIKIPRVQKQEKEKWHKKPFVDDINLDERWEVIGGINFIPLLTEKIVLILSNEKGEIKIFFGYLHDIRYHSDLSNYLEKTLSDGLVLHLPDEKRKKVNK